MDPLKPIWTDEYRVNWYEADTNNKASLVTICNYLQETAWRHANHLGFGYRTTNEINQVWVIVRLLVKMDRFPSWGETLTVRTWPRGMEGLLALRDFEILDPLGVRLGGAASQWLILDAGTRKPQASMMISEALPLATNIPALDEQPGKIIIQEPLSFQSSVKSKYTDLDMYHHVNNSRYLEWILDIFPHEFHKTHHVRSFLIEFLSETHFGEEIQIFAGMDKNPVLIRGVRIEDDKTIFRARMEFTPRV